MILDKIYSVSLHTSCSVMRSYTSAFLQLTRRQGQAIKHFKRTVSYNNVSFPPFSLLHRRAQDFPDRIAVIDELGQHTYKSLFIRSLALSERIKSILPDQNNTRLVFLCPNNVSYVVVLWACWISRHVAVPLNEKYPNSLLKYFVENSQASMLLTTKDCHHHLDSISKELNLPLVDVDEIVNQNEPETKNLSWIKSELELRTEKNAMQDLNAMMLYTSGTTGMPKGVVLTHSKVYAQVISVVEAWKWTYNDVVLHALPLHHTHGIIYALLSPLYIGATCIMLRKFDPKKVWDHFLSTDDSVPHVNVFTAVPTMYAKLISSYKEQFGNPDDVPRTREYIRALCKQRIRLMVSGSSALPEPIMQEWEALTDYKILERYGMTEIGMALSNPLEGPRIPGTVGTPVPGVQVKIIKPNVYSTTGFDVVAEGNWKSTEVKKGMENEIGELVVKGPNVFDGYWNKPDATKEAFTSDGYFKTGDTVKVSNGIYSILGRTSSDIIKSGGYKISALDVERHLLSHPDIDECTVVGLPDITWGERVAAVVVLHEDRSLTTDELREWCKTRMASYSVPTVVKFVKKLPRNVMGKVNKKEFVKNEFPEASAKHKL